MSKLFYRALSGRRSIHLFSLICVLTLSVILAMHRSFFQSSIQTYISDPVYFRLRELLGQTPPLVEQLKIIALDDQTVGYLNDNELSLKDLVLLLENIAKKKPKVILLDRLFAENPKGPNVEYWLQRLRSIDVPMYSGLYFSDRKIPFRDRLNETNGLAFSKNLFFSQDGYVYGYAQKYSGIFSSAGHIKQNGEGTFYPIISFNENTLVPHLGFYASDNLIVKDNSLFSNSRLVPIDKEGRLFFNYRPLDEIYKKSRSMRPMLERARNSEIEKNVSQGDTVLLLFNFYTGSTDFFSGGAFGEIPGGFLVALVADSVLSSNWIRKVELDEILIILFCLGGILVGIKSSPLKFWVVIFSFIIVYFCLAVLLFTYAALRIPLVLPSVSFMVSALIFYVYRRLIDELSKIQIQKDYFSEKSLRLEEENNNLQLQQRLDLGKAVQEILLPGEMGFKFACYNVGMRYRAAQEMSGDWLYVWKYNDQEMRVLIGDVVGKGPSAAIPVAIIIGVLGECERLSLSMDESIRRVNDRLVDLFSKQITSTCAAISLHSDGQITLFNSGSPGWFLFDMNGGNHFAMRSSPLGLNLCNEISVKSYRCIDLRCIFTFTDGYLEGSRAYRRLFRALSEVNQFSIDNIDSCLSTVGEGFRLEDDRSLVSLSFVGT